ncbi:hypothetical protein HOS00_gp18 [Klebsiella phage AltoGao]|uniref:Uncharacterized protein n=1 Tax=Klebsiella phage AltoGao TaxID=2026943 RepID=A0A248SKR7_9CAUD|nr:hypothetical protein HOS00_gp18 [Klebsiella phage AltoGao]ASV44911.1 hypothetical protein AltoGao_18 [Klebsiella phage AltoGao]
MNTTAQRQARTARITTLWSQRGELTQRKQMEQQLLVLLNQCAILAEMNSWEQAIQVMLEAGSLSRKIAG